MSEISIKDRLKNVEANKLQDLDLSNQNLDSIPEEVFALDSLYSLNLSNNNILFIPQEIENLRNIVELNLENNFGVRFSDENTIPLSLVMIDLSKTFSKNIPDWVLAHNWVRIDMSGCGISQIPEDLLNQKKIKSLFLSNNNISRVPEWFGKLNLRNLSLSYNELQFFPKEIIEFKDLEYLGISGNNIKQIPSQINELEKLKYFHAARCGLEEFPIQIIHNNKLESLNLALNNIREIPDEIAAFKYLERLDLEGNIIRELSDRIGELSNLERLDLSENKISVIPKEFSKLVSLNFSSSKTGNDKLYGLHLRGNPLPPDIRAASELPQPEATSRLLDLIERYSEISDPNSNPSLEPPSIQRPSIGPIFAERNEQLDLEPGQGFKNEPNKHRFAALYNELRETINDLDLALGSGTDSHQGLIKAARRYKSAINKPMEDTNVDQIYALGLRFESAWQAENRDIRSSFEPPLENSQQEALTSVLRIHAAFVASTTEGRELLEASLRYEFQKSSDEKFKSLARPVAEGVNRTPGMLTEEAGELLEEAVDGVAEGPSEGRTGLIGRLTVTNVLTAVAMAVVGRLASEIVLVSDVGQIFIDHGSSLFDKSIVFLLNYEHELRLLAANSPEGLGWIRHFLDWLKLKTRS